MDTTKLYTDLAGNIYIVEKDNNISIVFFDDSCYNILTKHGAEKLLQTFEDLGEI